MVEASLLRLTAVPILTEITFPSWETMKATDPGVAATVREMMA